MRCAFLELPWEIRKIIYDYALFGPTRHVTPSICRGIEYKRPRRPSKPGSPPAVTTAKRLHLVPCRVVGNTDSVSVVNDIPACGCMINSKAAAGKDTDLPVQHLIARVCKQMHNEIIDRPWESNILFFPHPAQIADVLHHMGQRLSRQFRSIKVNICFEASPSPNLLAKAFCKIVSRARHGKVSQLSIVLTNFSKQFEDIHAKSYILYHERLHDLEVLLSKIDTLNWPIKGFKRVLIIKAPLLVTNELPASTVWTSRNKEHLCWNAMYRIERVWHGEVELNGRRWLG